VVLLSDVCCGPPGRGHAACLLELECCAQCVWGEEVGVGVGERSRKRPALGLGLGQLGLDRQSSSLLGFFLAGNRETPVALLLPVVSTEFHHRRAPASSL
jgi:hypothetical protein